MYYTQKRPIDNVHIVRERDRQRFRELLAVLSLGIPIGLFLLLFTWQNLEVIRLGREATRLQQQRKQIEDSNKALQLELDRLTGLDTVEQKATALGFAATDPRSIIMVQRGVASPGGPLVPETSTEAAASPPIERPAAGEASPAATPGGVVVTSTAGVPR